MFCSVRQAFLHCKTAPFVFPCKLFLQNRGCCQATVTDTCLMYYRRHGNIKPPGIHKIPVAPILLNPLPHYTILILSSSFFHQKAMRRQDYVILLHIVSECTKEVLQRLKAWTDKFFRQIRDNVGTDLNGRYACS